MTKELEGKSIAILATDGFEDSEFVKPCEAVKGAGAIVSIVSEEAGRITGKNGTEYEVDSVVEDVKADNYDGLIIPGGLASPDNLRMNESALSFVRDFFAQHKPVAAICHGPWLLVEADVLQDKTVTSWPSLKTDITNAGGKWVDEEVVVDNGLVTSRSPDDLDAFCAKAVEEFAEGKHEGLTA